MPTEQTELVLADLDGRHGHLEPEPEPVCSANLTDMVTVLQAYWFTGDGRRSG